MNGCAALDGFSCPCCWVVKRAKAEDRFRPQILWISTGGVSRNKGQKSLVLCGFVDTEYGRVRVLYS